VDASPTGLGGILAQTDQRGKRRVVAYASKALNPTQQRYAQTEREALAIIWGCEHFRMYLLGAHFTVITDHKPLISIFNKPTSSLSAIMERWMLRKQPSVPKPLSPEEIAAETTKDKELQEVKKRWHFSSKIAETFYQIRDELTVSEQGIILRGVRICIPKQLQNPMHCHQNKGSL